MSIKKSLLLTTALVAILASGTANAMSSATLPGVTASPIVAPSPSGVAAPAVQAPLRQGATVDARTKALAELFYKTAVKAPVSAEEKQAVMSQFSADEQGQIDSIIASAAQRGAAGLNNTTGGYTPNGTDGFSPIVLFSAGHAELVASYTTYASNPNAMSFDYTEKYFDYMAAEQAYNAGGLNSVDPTVNIGHNIFSNPAILDVINSNDPSFLGNYPGFSRNTSDGNGALDNTITYLTFNGGDFIIAINRETNKAIGYGDLGITDGDVHNLRAVFVGDYNPATNTLTGGFRSLTGGSTTIPGGSANLDSGDPIAGRTTTINLSRLTSGGTLSANISLLNESGSVVRTVPISATVEDSINEVLASDAISSETMRGFVQLNEYERIGGDLVGLEIYTNADSADFQVVKTPTTMTIDVDDGFDPYTFSTANGSYRALSNGLAAVQGHEANETASHDGAVLFPIFADDNTLFKYAKEVNFFSGYSDTPGNPIAVTGMAFVGTPTSPGDMPNNITATYEGPAQGAFVPHSGMVQDMGGSTTLTANFSNNTFTGSTHLATEGNTVNVTLAGGGSISGNGFMGSVSGGGYTGSTNGIFVGPQAAELVGSVSAGNIGGDAIKGIFAGKK